jgi:hypothetical protein
MNADIKKKYSKITETERKLLETAIEDIKQLAQIGYVNEEALTKVTNIMTTFNSLKENYMWRVINNLKQNRMLD